MPNYRRSRVEGGTYFLTVVTYRRRPVFDSADARQWLRHAVIQTRAQRPWDMQAIVLLPDHLHMLWQLPDGDADYSTRIKLIKTRFTEAFVAAGRCASRVTDGEKRKGYRGVWQARFWEHTIRDPRDLKMHLDYIHTNPAKHELVEQPRAWPFSTFHRYVPLGEYDADWCGRVDLPDQVEYYDWSVE